MKLVFNPGHKLLDCFQRLRIIRVQIQFGEGEEHAGVGGIKHSTLFSR